MWKRLPTAVEKPTGHHPEDRKYRHTDQFLIGMYSIYNYLKDYCEGYMQKPSQVKLILHTYNTHSYNALIPLVKHEGSFCIFAREIKNMYSTNI